MRRSPNERIKSRFEVIRLFSGDFELCVRMRVRVDVYVCVCAFIGKEKKKKNIYFK